MTASRWLTVTEIMEYIDERRQHLEEELKECRSVGVDTPGFNQTLGALDELRFLRDEITGVSR